MISKCRGASAVMPSLREAWYKSAIRAENSWDDEFMLAELAEEWSILLRRCH